MTPIIIYDESSPAKLWTSVILLINCQTNVTISRQMMMRPSPVVPPGVCSSVFWLIQVLRPHSHHLTSTLETSGGRHPIASLSSCHHLSYCHHHVMWCHLRITSSHRPSPYCPKLHDAACEMWTIHQNNNSVWRLPSVAWRPLAIMMSHAHCTILRSLTGALQFCTSIFTIFVEGSSAASAFTIKDFT